MAAACHGAHNHLRRQRKAITNVVVDELVKAELAKYPTLPRLLADVIARSIGCLKRVEQQGVLVGRGLQFNLRCQFHVVMYNAHSFETQELKGEVSLSSPHLKVGVSGEFIR